MSVVHLDKVTKFYKSHLVLDSLSFSVAKGEIIGLLGSNGAGKTSLLKIIVGLLKPSSGRVEVDGLHLCEFSSEVRSVIGYAPDDPPLYSNMLIDEYLKYVLQLRNYPSHQTTERIEEVCRLLSLTDRRRQRISELSQGYKQRLNIAQALAHEPKLLILDEPINGLDPAQIVEIRDLIVSLKGKQTIIISSHILSEVIKTCERVLVLSKGLIVAEGKPNELEANFSKVSQTEVVVQATEHDCSTLCEEIRKVEFVTSVNWKQDTEGAWQVKIQSIQDVSPEIARVVINHSVDLLKLTPKENLLEEVLLSLMNKDGSGEVKY